MNTDQTTTTNKQDSSLTEGNPPPTTTSIAPAPATSTMTSDVRAIATPTQRPAVTVNTAILPAIDMRGVPASSVFYNANTPATSSPVVRSSTPTPSPPALSSPPRVPITANAATVVRSCNCKRSGCLKLYCECFASGGVCSGNCNCVSCKNNINHARLRDEAIEATLHRNPDAFRPKVAKVSKKHQRGCNCKKSGCLKKYCECFQAGVTCGDNCKCINCRNTNGSSDRYRALEALKAGKPVKSTPSSRKKRKLASPGYKSRRAALSDRPWEDDDMTMVYDADEKTASDMLNMRYKRRSSLLSKSPRRIQLGESIRATEKQKAIAELLSKESVEHLCEKLVTSIDKVQRRIESSTTSPEKKSSPVKTEKVVTAQDDDEDQAGAVQTTTAAPVLTDAESLATNDSLVCKDEELRAKDEVMVDSWSQPSNGELGETRTQQLEEEAVVQEFAVWMQRLTHAAIATVSSNGSQHE